MDVLNVPRAHVFGIKHGGMPHPQTDAESCGVFVLAWILGAVSGTDMHSVRQQDMPWLRWYFANLILNASLPAPPVRDCPDVEEGLPRPDNILKVYH